MLSNQSKRLAPPKQIPLIYPTAFTESSIRWLIFNEKTNGFSCCVKRIGRKVLIDLDQFEAWIAKQGEAHE
jgi:hypothetical protein